MLLPERYVADVEGVLREVAERRFGAQARRLSDVGRAVTQLAEDYRQRRRAPTTPLATLARLLFFTVADMPKVAVPLAELQARGLLPTAPSLRVLDVGCGLGAATLGLAGRLSQLAPAAELRIDAIDRDAEALALLEEIFAQCAARGLFSRQIAVRRRRLDLSRQPLAADGGYQLVLASALLVELREADHRAVVNRLLQRVDDEGFVVLIEPALRETTRALHRLRDELLADSRTALSVIAPSPRQGPCPALRQPDDWCHESRVWNEQPPLFRKLAARTGLRRRHVKFSQLILTRRKDIPPRPAPWRVVSELLRSKGRREVFLCGEPGRVRAARLDRHRTDANRSFERLRRGQWLELHGEHPAPGALAIDAATRVVIHDLAR